jgi:hypothetical protein
MAVALGALGLGVVLRRIMSIVDLYIHTPDTPYIFNNP